MKLSYREFGDGHPLIIIHGLYGASDNWVTVARALSKYFKVYAIDQRNHGQSPHSDEMTYQAMMDDLKEFIEAHQFEKVSLLGHSMGGKTAMFYAVKYPKTVSNLIVADISPRNYGTVPEETPQYQLHCRMIKAMKKVDLTGVKSRNDVDAALAKEIAMPQVRQFLMKNLHRKQDNYFEWKLNLNALSNHLMDVLAGIDPAPYKQENGITDFPALFLRGEKSDYIEKQDEKIINTIFPYAKIVTINNAGHWMHAEQPEAFIKAIKDFIF